MTKGLNFKEPITLGFNKAFKNTNSTINNYIQDLSKQTKFPVESFSKWKVKLLNKVKTKIKHLKSNMKQHQTKLALCDYEVKTYLEPLMLQLTKLLITILFIRKRFYTTCFLAEVGIFSNSNTETFSLTRYIK